jgi:hypothetical protein
VKLCGKKTPLVTVGRRRRRTVHHRQESQGGGHSHKKKNTPFILHEIFKQLGRRCFRQNFKATDFSFNRSYFSDCKYRVIFSLSTEKKNAPSLLQFGHGCFHLNFKATLPLTVHIPHTATTLPLLFHYSVRENINTYLLFSFLFCNYPILSIFQLPQNTPSVTCIIHTGDFANGFITYPPVKLIAFL